MTARQAFRTLILGCLVVSFLSESHAQDRRSASAALHIQLFVMPTLVAAADPQHPANNAQSLSVSFTLSEQNRTAVMHSVRPLAPTTQPAVTTSQDAVLDTATFVAE
jgi:hypothetical protein